jgi:DNA-binding IclR family transcriptional regulator
VSVKAVSRSFDVLEALASADDLGLVELATRTGLQPSTVHRLLQTLVARGYATQDPGSRRYLLSYKASELSDAVATRHQHLRVVARPHLETIVKLTGESANLSVLEPPSLVYVDQVDGSRSVRMFARRGAAVPAYATAAGKALLAWAKPDVVRRLPDPLVQLTARTISSHRVLLRELARVRANGYATDEEEQEAGVGCVAAPIGSAHGAGVVAAISVSAPMTRIREAGPAKLAALLMTGAAAISGELFQA